MMLADMAVLSYHNALRVQDWIGGAALWLEREFFGGDLRGVVAAGEVELAVGSPLAQVGGTEDGQPAVRRPRLRRTEE